MWAKIVIELSDDAQLAKAVNGSKVLDVFGTKVTDAGLKHL